MTTPSYNFTEAQMLRAKESLLNMIKFGKDNGIVSLQELFNKYPEKIPIGAMIVFGLTDSIGSDNGFHMVKDIDIDTAKVIIDNKVILGT